MNQIAIQETIQRLINQQVVSGVAWGTITEDSLSEQYTGFLGNTGPFAKQKVSSASLYDLASLTKVIGTTNRMLQLIDTNQLTFSTTVGEILPDYQGLSCSIGELLLHQSGLPADVVDKKMSQKKLARNHFNAIRYLNEGKPLILIRVLLIGRNYSKLLDQLLIRRELSNILISIQ